MKKCEKNLLQNKEEVDRKPEVIVEEIKEIEEEIKKTDNETEIVELEEQKKQIIEDNFEGLAELFELPEEEKTVE